MNDEYYIRLGKVEQQYGKRPLLPVAHGEALQLNHFRGELNDGQKFVYCPIGFICSWHPKDYENKYCAWCREFFNA